MKSIKITEDNNKWVGVIRIMLGLIFIMTGVMKLLLPDYGTAWQIQLVEANIPFRNIMYFFVPVFEILLGAFLLVGYYARTSSFFVILIMIVAVYVHLTVTNPGAFPSQPQQPYMPIMVIILASFIIRKGAGAWSLDSNVDKN